MSGTMLLMHKDSVVMRINFYEGEYSIISPNLMPYQLRGKIQKVASFEEIKTKADDTARRIAINKNYNAVVSYLAARVLPLTRENAKIYKMGIVDYLVSNRDRHGMNWGGIINCTPKSGQFILVPNPI